MEFPSFTKLSLFRETDPCYSVEANVVVIASCIPTLSPLLELLWGKRQWASSNDQRKYYQHNSSYANDLSSRTHQYHVRTKGNMDIPSDEESQHSILQQDGNQSRDFHIRRTDEVCVEYEMQSQTPAIRKQSF